VTKTTDESFLKLFCETELSDGPEAEVQTEAVITFDPVAELDKMQRALRRAEAELAAGVPLIAQPRPQRHLSERLESVLKASAEAIGCRSAGLYLLDDATTELKLRASYGLPTERLLEPARALRTAMADLEALAGHAVALEDTAKYQHWNLPEPCGAAVCVPVSSPTTPLGTLWVFSDEPRPLSDHEVNLVEIAAGRIASDLEREMLLTETHDVARMRRAWSDAGERRAARVPQVAPLCDRWEIAARADDDSRVQCDFYDWLTANDGALCVALGSVEAADFAAALEVEALRSSWRAHTRHSADCGHWLEWLNDDLWRGSTDAVEAHMLALRAAANGTLSLAVAGTPTALVLGLYGTRSILPAEAAPTLGRDGEFRATAWDVDLAVGESLLLGDDVRRIERVAAVWNSDALRVTPRISSARLLDQLLSRGRENGGGRRGTYLLLRRTS
jgi:hypothetical protein